MGKGFNRLTIRAVLVLTMALGGGLLGAGCGTDEPGDNEAGSGGGVAGSGGEGIGGSAGNEAGSGGGGTGGAPATPEDFTPCTEVGATAVPEDGGLLVCSDIFTAGSLWVRACDTNAECTDASTWCQNTATGGAFPFCLLNRCGDDRNFDDATNGDFFEACSQVGFTVSDDGKTVVPDELVDGTCLPLGRNDDGTAFGVCLVGGEIPAGGACGNEDARDRSTLCEVGTACAVPTGSTEGTCTDTCDAVNPERDATFAGCDVAGNVCNLAVRTPPSDTAIGFCAEPEEGGDESGDDEGGEG